jgi:hypothetical protein
MDVGNYGNKWVPTSTAWLSQVANAVTASNVEGSCDYM